MGTAMRTAADSVKYEAFYAQLEAEPFAHDFYQTLRRLECLHVDKPRWGTALRPADEPVRLAQEPSMAFAPSSLSSFSRNEGGRPPRLEIRFFGLLGPNGPLPLHLTDHARQRILHEGDATFSRFLDIIHHRMTALFYRAWAQAQPTVSLDRPQEDRFAHYVGALCGFGQPALLKRDAVPDNARRFNAGAMVRNVRNADSLESALTEYFGLPVEIEQYVGHWMPIEAGDQSRLGSSMLARNAVLGSRVWDRQSKFRICIGPLDATQYADFLPDGSALPKLVELGAVLYGRRVVLGCAADPAPAGRQAHGARRQRSAGLDGLAGQTAGSSRHRQPRSGCGACHERTDRRIRQSTHGSRCAGMRAPAWFTGLRWSDPEKIEDLRKNRGLLPRKSGVYVFTNYSFALEKNTGVLYVGKATSLYERVQSYLADPTDVQIFSRRYGGTRVSSTLKHPGKAQLLMEVAQRMNMGCVPCGIWVRWLVKTAPAVLEDDLIKYLQPAFNTRQLK
ncbi:MAG: type VI secretion system baseplate subunit TssG [Rhodocyclaceae bacterium]